MSGSVLSRAKLTERLASAEADIRMLAALVHILRTQVAYHEYVRSSSGWSYDPTAGYSQPAAYTKKGFPPLVAGTRSGTHARGAVEFNIPSIKAMYEHKMRVSALDVADE
jgi:hypothetical protein